MNQVLIDFLTPYGKQIADAITLAVVSTISVAAVAVAAWLRSKFQLTTADAARAEVEAKTQGAAKVPGEVKLEMATQLAIEALPWHARPLTRERARLVVQKTVDAAKVRESLAPKEQAK